MSLAKKVLSKVVRKNKKLDPISNKVEAPLLIPASSGESMKQFTDWIKQHSSLKPKNIFEIGANMAQDAEVLRKEFNLDPADVWVFEPHPQLFEYIKQNYRFHAYDYAVLDRQGTTSINFIDINKNSNSGISSVRRHTAVPKNHFKVADVECVRMDDFIKKHKIHSIDFLKLDVEGCNYEVLDGFGDKLNLVKSIHIEAEHIESWEGEKLWNDIRSKLEPHFELVYFQRYYTQSDSFWINKKYLRNEP